jgi:hypothetical protein
MKKNIFLKYLFSILSFLALSLPTASLALTLNLDYPAFGGFDLNNNQDLNQIVAWFYYFIIGIAGLSAFIMLTWGGFQYLTSAGNPAAIGDAKDKIKSALLGLLLILISWLILQVINPDLTTLNLPQLH